MKKWAMMSSAAIAAVLLTGCYPTGEIAAPEDVPQYLTEDAESTRSGEAIPDTAAEPSLKNVIVSLSLPSSPSEVSEFDATVKCFDAEALKNVFLAEQDDVTEETYESDVMPDQTAHVFQTSQDHRLITDAGRISFTDMGDPNRSEYSSLGNSWFYDDTKMLWGDQELEGFPLQEAADRVTALAEQCGITDYGDPLTYPLSAENVNRYYQKSGGAGDKEGNLHEVSWGRDEEAYVLVFPQILNGIALDTQSTFMQAVVTRNGIVDFRVEYWMDAETGGNMSLPLRYTAADTANVLIDYYEGLAMLTPVELLSCELVGISQKDDLPYHCVPVWRFDVKGQVASEEYMLQREYVSALTGKRVEVH